MKLSLRAPHTVYKLKDGTKVPGVTTTQNVFAKQALMGWYASEEREGILALMREARNNAVYVLDDKQTGPLWTADTIKEHLPRNKDGDPQWFANIKRDSAADLGKVAHAHVEAYWKGDRLEADGLDAEMYAQADVIANRYLVRIQESGFKCIHSEHVMVDEDLRVGGTGDAFGTMDGFWVYRDLKTSKPWFKGKPYAENIAQAAGYAMMFEKQQGVEVKKVCIDRIGKTLDDPGDYFVLTPEQRAMGEKRFKLGVMAYYCDRDMEDALKEGSLV